MDKRPAGGDRRDALGKMISVMGMCALEAAPPLFLSGCESTSMKSTGQGEEFDVGSAPELAKVGGAIKKTFGTNNSGQPVFIIRKAEKEFLVLSTTCTFEGCEVNLPVSPGALFVCPCCLSNFAFSDGSVVKKPAPAPLRRIPSSYYAPTNKLTITF